MGQAYTALDKLQKTLSKNLDIAFDRNRMSDVADILIKNIVLRARLGKGVENGKQKNFLPLTDDYINYRKRHAGNLDKDTNPNQRKSNAIATGQMLNSIDKKVGVGNFILYFKGKRKAELDGKARGLSNDEVAGYYQIKRPFFEITSADVNEVKRYIRSIILKR